jgi:hypothetical protein
MALWLGRLLPRFGARASGGPTMLGVGIALLAAIVVVGVLSPWIVPHDPLAISPLNSLEPMSSTYLLGTDQLGRDLGVAIDQGRAILESAAADSPQETSVQPVQRRTTDPSLRRGNLPDKASSLTGPAPAAQSARAGLAETRKSVAPKPRAAEVAANRLLR